MKVKRRNKLSHLIAFLARGVIGKFPKLYVIANRLNRAVIRQSFSGINQETLLSFWKSFDFVSLAPENYQHFGDRADGGYFLATPISRETEVLSVGLGDNISFDYAISSSVSRIHMFDHTISEPNHIPINAKYYSKGLGATTHKNLMDLPAMLSLTKSSSPKILKIDIEGAEWEVLQELNIDVLLSVNQIIIEFHNLIEIVRNPASFQNAVKVLEFIRKEFWAVNVNANNWANSQIIHGVAFADVLEVTFLRKNDNTSVRTQKISSQGFPNNLNEPKLLLGNFDEIFR